MIKILALDISSHAGFAVVEAELQEATKVFVLGGGTEIVPPQKPTTKLVHYGIVGKSQAVNGYGAYPWSYHEVASNIATPLFHLVLEHGPDAIVIEETNLGKNRYAQKLLEFIHFAFLNAVRTSAYKDRVIYLSSSEWRRALGLVMTKDQKKANAKLAKAKKEAEETGVKLDKKILGVRGKVTKKHLAVEHANRAFDLKLKVKDNDIADAICLALAHLAGAEKCDGVM
jgi:Holliday junction resolvasome RuvABC endonuclease subunit